MVLSADQWTVEECRRFKRASNRACELCSDTATRIVDVKHGDEVFETYILCNSAVCLQALKDNAGVV